MAKLPSSRDNARTLPRIGSPATSPEGDYHEGRREPSWELESNAGKADDFGSAALPR
jgi:hypothetical protein